MLTRNPYLLASLACLLLAVGVVFWLRQDHAPQAARNLPEPAPTAKPAEPVTKEPTKLPPPPLSKVIPLRDDVDPVLQDSRTARPPRRALSDAEVLAKGGVWPVAGSPASSAVGGFPVVAPPAPSVPVNLKLDINVGINTYGTEGDLIFGIGPGSFSVTRKLSLIIVQDLSVTHLGEQQPGNDVGITPTNHNAPVISPNRCVVETKHFEGSLPGGGNDLEEFYLTCAHEIGHALGVCTRDDGASIMHDPGDFPSNQYNLDGTPANNGQAPRMNGSLMKEGLGAWKWILHEDWKWANEQAPQFTP